MDILYQLFGVGRNLSTSQMTLRGIVIFIVALILIRISGRRSFGMRTPLDNIVVVLLGAILSRSVVGASPILPTICTCAAIVIIHRAIGYLAVKNVTISNLIEGKKILLYRDGAFISRNLRRALVSEEDVMQGVRKSALTDDLRDIELIYMERNGKISAIKKKGN